MGVSALRPWRTGSPARNLLSVVQGTAPPTRARRWALSVVAWLCLVKTTSTVRVRVTATGSGPASADPFSRWVKSARATAAYEGARACSETREGQFASPFQRSASPVNHRAYRARQDFSAPQTNGVAPTPSAGANTRRVVREIGASVHCSAGNRLTAREPASGPLVARGSRPATPYGKTVFPARPARRATFRLIASPIAVCFRTDRRQDSFTSASGVRWGPARRPVRDAGSRSRQQSCAEVAGWLAGRSRPPRLDGMKTLDDVVIQLEKHGLQLEKQSETLDEVVRMAREIQTSQSALANAGPPSR